MNRYIKPLLAVSLAAGLGAVSLQAHADTDLTVRAEASVGHMAGQRYEQAGVRLLLPANDRQSYGLELSHLTTKRGNYTAAGIVLEQGLWGWFHMSIGTVAYLGSGTATPNAPGLVAELGWSPGNGPWRPYVNVRNDIILAQKTQTGSALSAGVSYRF